MAKLLVTVSAVSQIVDTTKPMGRYAALSDAQIIVEMDDAWIHNSKARDQATADGLRRAAELLEAGA